MRRNAFLVLILVLACLVDDSVAVSPMPIEELKPGQTIIACALRMDYAAERGKIAPEETYSETLFFEVSAPKKDVLEEMNRRIDDRLQRGNVSEMKLNCTFPK